MFDVAHLSWLSKLDSGNNARADSFQISLDVILPRFYITKNKNVWIGSLLLYCIAASKIQMNVSDDYLTKSIFQ